MAYCGNFGRYVAQRGTQTSADFSLRQACKLQSHFGNSVLKTISIYKYKKQFNL